MPTSRVRAEVRTFLNRPTGVIYKSISTAPLQPRSTQSFSISNNDKPPVSKRRKTHHASLDAHAVSNPKPSYQPSSPSATSSAKVPVSRMDPDALPVLEYDLDRDPTQRTCEFHDQFHERSSYSALLSARFIHAHMIRRLLDSTASSGELTNNEGNLVVEFAGAAALDSVANPSYALEPAEVFGNSAPPPSYGDLDLEGSAHVTDPFTVPTMDDVINLSQWGPDAGTTIDPSLLGGTPAFSEPRSPSPAPTPFRDFHSWRKARTPSPPLVRSASSGSDPSESPRNPEADLGGRKAKFYKKGTLQIPPHLSNSQRRSGATMTDGTHISDHTSSDEVAPAEIDSPLTELSTSDLLVSGIASVPPRVNATSRNRESSIGNRGLHRIVAVNESTNCHQCRRTTPHPKMRCRACTKHYCILCIVKRYAPPC